MNEDLYSRAAMITGEWFDAPLSAAEAGEMHDVVRGLDRATQAQIADLQLLHAMLGESAVAAAAARDRRVDRVLESLGTPDAFIRPRRSAWRATRWAAAAVVLIGSVIAVLSLPTPDAAASAVRRLIRATETGGDRVYIITTEMSGDTPGGPVPGAPPGPKRVGPSVRQLSADVPPPGGAILYARGPSQYVLVRRLDDGRTLITGSDGRESWSVPPDGPVIVNGDPLAFRGPMPGLQTRVPFIDIRAGLEELQTAYRIELMPAWSRKGEDPVTFQRLRAERKTDNPEKPQLIHVWWDGDSGLVHQVQMDGMSRRDYPRLTRLTVELLEQRMLAADWFDHTSHHAADREVRRADQSTIR